LIGWDFGEFGFWGFVEKYLWKMTSDFYEDNWVDTWVPLMSEW
jgi:hypothetical protein